MKLQIISFYIFLSLSTLALTAKEPITPKCNNKSTCVDDQKFYVEVKRVVKRGEVLIVQLTYIGKTARPHYFEFTHNSFEGHVSILDANGQEFKVSGKEISDFYLAKEEKKVISFKFKGDKQNKITMPFDLTIKTYTDEVTLFDLKP